MATNQTIEQHRTAQQTKGPAMPDMDLSGKAHNLPAAPKKKKLLERLADEYGVDPAKLADTLKKTAFKGSRQDNGQVRDATDEELMALLIVAEQYGLNPFTKEIYAFFDKQRGGIVPVIGVDGWIRIVNEHPQFDGMQFEYTYDAESGEIYEVTCTIWRKDRTKPIIMGELYDECARETNPWKKSPRRMLRHKALIQCARYAFGFAGVNDEDEVLGYIDGTASEVDDIGNALTTSSGSGIASINRDVKRQSAAKTAPARKGETIEGSATAATGDGLPLDTGTGEVTKAPNVITQAIVIDKMNGAVARKDLDELDAHATLIEEIQDEAIAKETAQMYASMRAELVAAIDK